MGAIVDLFGDMARIALGLTPFSFLFWAYVTVLLLVCGPVFAQVAPRVVDPPARLIATDPLRVIVWMPLSVLALVAVTVAVFITIIGALLMPIVGLLVGMAGYLALARLVGERVLAAWSALTAPPWLAAAVGIVLLRLVRLVPFVGAFAHSLLAWIGFAAATACAVRGAWAWHRRRMPDVVQFRGETLVEWYPDGDPADGRPSFGTGRPVLGNVRGDEDRLPPPEAPDEA
ncbi:MAG: hypothetical protein JWM98_2096 [Thermoleophilia bacterium]|nr:hypothetical protein [Thermoleophilia bacterium]